MDKKGKDQKEQEILRKIHERTITFRQFFLNIIIVLWCIVSVWGMGKYLKIAIRSTKENEQIVLCILMLVSGLLLLALNNFWGDMLFEKFLTGVNKRYENKNKKAAAQIKNLNDALHHLSQSPGVIVWDTIWGSFAFFLTAALIAFFKTCNKPVVLGMLAFILVMLFGGHFLMKKLWMNTHYEKKLCKYTKKYLNIPDDDFFIASLDKSIQRGVLGYAGIWMLTDEYMIGRLSDVTNEPVAIPRSAIVKITFFLEKSLARKGLPIGILQCQLNNGKCVRYELGRAKACDQALLILNEQKVYWVKEEMRYQ